MTYVYILAEDVYILVRHQIVGHFQCASLAIDKVIVIRVGHLR